MLVNDISSRTFNGTPDGRVVIGPNGGTIAATPNTTLTVFSAPIDYGANTLTIGTTIPADGLLQPRIGTVVFSTMGGWSTALPGSRIHIVPGATLRTGFDTIPDAVNLVVDGTLNISASPGTVVIGSLAGAGLVELPSMTLIVGANDNSTSFAGTLTGSGGVLLKRGAGRLDLTCAENPFNGSLRVGEGTLALSGNGTLPACASITLLSGGTLLLDNTGTRVDGRLPGRPLTLQGGTLRLAGHDAAATTESLGTLSVSGGTGTIDLVNGSGPGASITLTLSAVSVLAPGGILALTSPNGMIGTAGDNPRVYINGQTAGFLQHVTVNGDPAWYDVTYGVRAVDAFDLVEFNGLLAQNSQDTVFTVNNVYPTCTFAKTVNSLWVRSPGNGRHVDLGDTGNFTLSLFTGRLQLSGYNDFTITRGAGSTGTLLRPSNGQMYLCVDEPTATLTIGVPLANGTGNTEKDGPGTLVLAAANTFRGDLGINNGTVRYASDGSGALFTNAVSIWNPGCLDFNGDSDTLGAVRVYSGNLSVAGPGDTELGGEIGIGSGTLSKYGEGTLKLAGEAANTYSGRTTVYGGLLLLAKANGNAIGNGGLTVNASGCVRYGGPTNNTDMMGGGTILLYGNGHVDFKGATDAVGPISISSSGIYADTTNLLNTGSGGALTVGGTLSLTPWQNYLLNVDSGSGTLKLGGGLTFTASDNGQARIIGSLDLNDADRTFAVNGYAGNQRYELEIPAVISGATNGFVKSGSGTLRLSGANTFGGRVSQSGGSIVLAHPRALGNPSTNQTQAIGNNATLALEDTGMLYDPNGFMTPSLTGNGDTRLAGWAGAGGALVNVRGMNVVPCPVTLLGNTQIASARPGDRLSLTNRITGATYGLTVDGAGDTEIGGDLALGTGGLIKNGLGSLTLTASNTYTGATIINTGVASLAGANGAILRSSGITLAESGCLSLMNTLAENALNRVIDDKPITMAGGRLAFTNDGSAAHYSETLGALLLTVGNNTVEATPAPPGMTSTLTLGGLTNLGSVVDFTGAGLGDSDRNRIFIVGQPDGLIGGWATIAHRPVVPAIATGWTCGLRAVRRQRLRGTRQRLARHRLGQRPCGAESVRRPNDQSSIRERHHAQLHGVDAILQHDQPAGLQRGLRHGGLGKQHSRPETGVHIRKPRGGRQPERGHPHRQPHLRGKLGHTVAIWIQRWHPAGQRLGYSPPERAHGRHGLFRRREG